jgi:REP element-mobilizing transposase RayT
MPDHVHSIIVIDDSRDQRNVGAQHAAPPPLCALTSSTNEESAPAPGSLGAIVRSFKSATTKRINQRRRSPGKPVWQRNYFDRIIRDDEELYRVRRYIMSNPDRWSGSADP